MRQRERQSAASVDRAGRQIHHAAKKRRTAIATGLLLTATTIWGAVIGAAGVIVAAIIGIVFRPRQADAALGEIRSPTSGERVRRKFMVDGTLSKKIPRRHHVWLAVQLGNLLFPKTPEIPTKDRHWAQEIFEAGNPPGGTFSVVLLMVDAKGQRTIEEWLARGREPGKGFSGIAEIPGSVKLSVVRELVLDEA